MSEMPKKSIPNQNHSLNNNDETQESQKEKRKDDIMTTSTLEKHGKIDEIETRTVTSTIQKWGNSLAIRIPKEMAANKAFAQGTQVEIFEIADGIKIVPKKKRIEYNLAELLSQCKPGNRHDLIDFGTTGKELI